MDEMDGIYYDQDDYYEYDSDTDDEDDDYFTDKKTKLKDEETYERVFERK